MSRPAASEGSYVRLTEGETHRNTHTHNPAGLPPPRQGAAGPYRLATICLATLCTVLLISIISISAHNKNGGGGGGGGGEEAAELQRQTQDANMSRLQEVIDKLLEEKKQLERERDELRAQLEAAKAPPVVPVASARVPTVSTSTTTTTKSTKTTVTTATMASPIVCPPDWHLFNNSCYFVSRNSQSWSSSQEYCKSKGAYLTIILTEQEQTFVWELLPRGHWNAFWIGITDEHTEDQWKWVDGTLLQGGFWEEGEPNNHINEDCGYIVKTQVLERVAIRSWYDAPCGMDRYFICEKEMRPAA